MIFRQISERRELHVGVVAVTVWIAVLRQALVGDDLREDGDRDLPRRDRADVQTDGCADAGKPVLVKALILQHLQKPLRPPPRADHAQIGGEDARQQGAQTVRVVPVAAGDDHHIVKGRNAEPSDAVFKAVAEHLGGVGEAAAVGKVRAVVDHGDRKTALCAKLTDRQRNVTAAEDDQTLLRQHGFEYDEAVLSCLRRHAGKAAALRVRHGRDGGESPAQPAFDFPGLTADDRFQRDGLIVRKPVYDFPIDVFH